MRRIALIMAAATLLAACGSDGDDGESSDGGNNVAATESPLAEFLGQDVTAGLDEDAAQATYIAQERERQEMIATCMQEQGFEYTPTDPEQYSSFGPAVGDLEWGSEEWIRKYGYGQTTQWFPQSAVGPDLLGYDDAAIDAAVEEAAADPNAALVEAMSETEQEAYYNALYGDQSQFDAFEDETLTDEERDEALDDIPFEPMGCEGEAFSAVQSGNGADTAAFYSDFSDELEQMWTRVQDDPRIVEAEQAVAECVREKGLEYVTEEDYYAKSEQALAAMQNEIFPTRDLSEDQLAAMTEEEIEDAFSATGELSAESKAQLATLQEEEIAVAVAGLECGGGWANQQALYNEVRIEYEQQFLDDNAAELEQYKAAG